MTLLTSNMWSIENGVTGVFLLLVNVAFLEPVGLHDIEDNLNLLDVIDTQNLDADEVEEPDAEPVDSPIDTQNLDADEVEEPDAEPVDSPTEPADVPSDDDTNDGEGLDDPILDAPSDTPPDDSEDSPVDMELDVSEIEVDLGPHYLLSLSVSGSGVGTVVSEALGIECGTDASDCSVPVAVDSEVTLSSETLGGSSVTDWDVVLCHGYDECTFTVDEDMTLEISIDITENLIFITSHVTEGGLAAADARCNEAAETAGLPGTYVAWLSTAVSPPTSWARTRLTGPRGWVRYDGRPVANELADLEAGEMFHPVLFNELGVEMDEGVATGTNGGGFPTESNCNNWEVSDSGTASGGFSTATTNYWTDGNEMSCGTVYVYCMGTDVSVEVVEPEPAAGLNAFLAPGFNTDVTGISAADAHCNDNSGDLPGTYRALLPYHTTGDVEFFTALEHLFSLPPGDPIPWPAQVWVRPDGVPIVENPEDLATGTLLAPLNVTPSGDYLASAVWTGSPDGFLFLPPGDIDDFRYATCGNWVVQLSGWGSVAGMSSFTSTRMYNDSLQDCDQTLGLYCFQVPE